MDWSFVLETLVKWGIPVLAAAVIGFIVKHLIDPNRKDRETGASIRKQKEWDAYAEKSNVMAQKCSCEIQRMETEIDKKFKQAEAANRLVDDQILIAVQNLQISVGEIKDDIKATREGSNLLQEGVLDLHLNNLVAACKTYIERGYITPIELMQYNERMTLYHKLGGNGHMDVWDERVRALPLHEHSEAE